jgi:hypothetical protein
MTTPIVSFASEVDSVLTEIGKMLVDKNRKYGDSALNPKRIFATSSTVELINVRIDDKLSRIASGQADETEDAEFDLIGYLVLKRIAKNRLAEARNLNPALAS